MGSLLVVVATVVHFAATVGMELEHTTYCKGNYRYSSKPPCHRNALCETRDYQKYRTYNVEDNRQGFHTHRIKEI